MRYYREMGHIGVLRYDLMRRGAGPGLHSTRVFMCVCRNSSNARAIVPALVCVSHVQLVWRSTCDVHWLARQIRNSTVCQASELTCQILSKFIRNDISRIDEFLSLAVFQIESSDI